MLNTGTNRPNRPNASLPLSTVTSARATVTRTVMHSPTSPSWGTVSLTPKGAVPITRAPPMHAATITASMDLRPSWDQ